MKILLADDHAILRSGLRRIVADAFPDAIIGEAGTCEEVRRSVQASEWSVLVLDITMGDRNSLEIVPSLLDMRPEMAIVVLTMHGERQFVLRALRSGVSGYLTKERAPEELLEAIRAVLAGRRFLGQSVAERLAEHLALAGSGIEAPHELLSEREYEVFRLLAEALSVSEIAQRLKLSVKTVSTYRSRVLEKMGMTSNAQLMRYALEHSLIA